MRPVLSECSQEAPQGTAGWEQSCQHLTEKRGANRATCSLACSAGGARGEQTGAFYGPKTEEEFYEILVTALSPSLLPSISIFSSLK